MTDHGEDRNALTIGHHQPIGRHDGLALLRGQRVVGVAIGVMCQEQLPMCGFYLLPSRRFWQLQGLARAIEQREITLVQLNIDKAIGW